MYCLPRAAQRPSAQRFHQVDDLAAFPRRFGHGDLLAFHLLLHRCFYARAHLVGISARIEPVGGLLLDQLLRELELRVAHFGLRNVDVLDGAHFARVHELLHHQAVLDRADHDDVLLAARRPAAERTALRLAQRLGEKRIGLGAALVGREVIGFVEVHRVDGLDRHEFADVRRAGAGFLQSFQLLGREHHVLVLGELVAFDHVFARDRDLFLDAEILLAQARAARLVQQVERDGAARLGRRKELDRNRHQPERNRQRCNRSRRHTASREGKRL